MSSNLSLKEQLEALSLGKSTPTATEKKDKKNFVKKNSPPNNNPKQKPVWLEQAQYGVELLKAYFPNCFKDPKEIKPLKVGIKQDLVKRLSTLTDIVVSDKACMVNSLAYYVNSPAYHKNIVVGVNRIDLDGNEAGAVTPEEANYSIERRKAKQQKKSLNEQNVDSVTR
jgi:sRNA-binding protein